MVRVLPEGTIAKTFDYLVPDHLGDQVRVGTRVRVELHGRRVGGWVIADHVDPPPGIKLRPLAKVSGWGPPPDLVDLSRWAARRWAGRPASFLGTASPDHVVAGLPSRRPRPPATAVAVGSPYDDLVGRAFAGAGAVVRLPPVADAHPFIAAAVARGNALILAPSLAQARHIGVRLRRSGTEVAIMPRDWAAARAGAVVTGSRAAAWAPVIDLAAVVVLDEHDEVYQEERAPTWHARDVALERARRAGVPCVLISPMPTLEAEAWALAADAAVLRPGRVVEREGWPVVDVVDRRKEEPGRGGLYSERLVQALRSDQRVVCVLNRKGRARLLACTVCGEATRCDRCQASVAQTDDGTLVCRRCGTPRPLVCQSCGATKLKNLVAGVARAREELEALVREPVVEVTGETAAHDLAPARVYVGTEAALHQVPDAGIVAFLDFDQELLAPRYRAAEQALSLLVRGARLLGRGAQQAPAAARGRIGLGRLLVQTRMPHHEVIQAALHADPGRVADAERRRREFLRFPPVCALAAVSGPAAPAFVESFGHPAGIEVLGPSDGQWLLRAPDHQVLGDALAATTRPGGRLRIEVDPLRL